MTGKSQTGSPETQNPHWVEWLTGLASSLIVFSILCWVGFEALTQKAEPPDLAVVINGDSQTEAGRHVEFRIVNRSDRTAATVSVRGEAMQEGRAVETHEVILDYVPAQSSARGAFIFSSNLAGLQIRIRPGSYAAP